MNHLNSKSDLTKLESFICGANAGLVTRFVIAPIDLVKIRLQLDEKLSFWTINSILKNEGFRAFWKGNSPAELLYVAYSSVQFSSLTLYNKLLLNSGIKNEQFRQFVAGGLAGSTATFVSYPLDYLRTRTAANQETTSALLKTIKTVYKNEGIRGFYHGCGATVLQVFPYMSLFFGTYSYLRDKQLDSVFTAASLASLSSKALIYPLDTIRKRVQVHGNKSLVDAGAAGFGERYSHNVFQAGKKIVQLEGVRGLYRGLIVSLVKTWPGSFVSMMVFEGTLNVLRMNNTN